MSKTNGSRKIGRNKRKPSNIAYAATGRLDRNKRRNKATEQERQRKDAEKADSRKVKRAKGAARRLGVRIAKGANISSDTIAKVNAACA